MASSGWLDSSQRDHCGFHAESLDGRLQRTDGCRPVGGNPTRWIPGSALFGDVCRARQPAPGHQQFPAQTSGGRSSLRPDDIGAGRHDVVDRRGRGHARRLDGDGVFGALRQWQHHGMARATNDPGAA